jgi:hypothetical protein
VTENQLTRVEEIVKITAPVHAISSEALDCFCKAYFSVGLTC